MLREFDCIQNEYLELLKKIKSELETDEISYYLDRLRTFWYKNSKIIDFCMEYIFGKSDTYFFSATSFLNLEDKRNLSLFSMGKYQIYDDPLVSYLSFIDKTSQNSKVNSKFRKKMKSAILKSVDNEITLLEMQISNFYIIPLRFFHFNKNILGSNVDNIVMSFFQKGIDLNELHSYEDADLIIQSELISQVFFCEEDRPDRMLKDRLDYYRENYSGNFPEELTDAELVKFILYGIFSQAIHIFYTSLIFEIYPMFPCTYIYLNYIFLLNNLFHTTSDEKIKKLQIYSRVALIVWCEFNKIGKKYNINNLRETVVEKEYYIKIKRILKTMSTADLTDSILIEDVTRIVHQCLD